MGLRSGMRLVLLLDGNRRSVLGGNHRSIHLQLTFRLAHSQLLLTCSYFYVPRRQVHHIRPPPRGTCEERPALMPVATEADPYHHQSRMLLRCDKS